MKSDPHALQVEVLERCTDAKAISEYRSPEEQRHLPGHFQGLVDSAELLAATKSTGHLVSDPRCLCGDKPLACLYRTAGMILFQPRDIDNRIVKALRKLGINSTSIYPEHPAPHEFFQKPGWETSIGKATIVVCWCRCAEAS
jgi:hypothetical protein